MKPIKNDKKNTSSAENHVFIDVLFDAKESLAQKRLSLH